MMNLRNRREKKKQQDNIRVTFKDIQHYDLTVHANVPAAGSEANLNFFL